MVIVKENRVICAVTVAVNFQKAPAGYSSDVKELCVKMSLNGMGFRAIERVNGISHNTVLNWHRQVEALIRDENYEIPAGEA